MSVQVNHKEKVFNLPIRILSLLLAVMLSVLFMQPHVLADEFGYSSNTNGYIKLVRSFINQKGNFCMEVEASGLENGSIDGCLIDESGVVIDRWSTLDHTNYTYPVKYTFSRDYSITPTGQYTMMLTYSTAFNTQSWSFGIKHTQKAVMTLKEAFKIKQDDGSYVHKLVFNLNGAQGKALYCEIYSKDGKLLKQYSLDEFLYGSGKWTVKWDYYPTKGLKVTSGDYIIKYWIKDGTPKQTTIAVQI